MALNNIKSRVIDGTDATWAGIAEMAATQAVSSSQKYYAFTIRPTMAKKAEIDRSNAEQQLRLAAERAEEKRRMALVPHVVTDWPRKLYCQEVPSADEWLPAQAEKGLKEGAAFRLELYSGNVNMIPLVDGQHVGPEFRYERQQGYYSYFGNGSEIGC